MTKVIDQKTLTAVTKAVIYAKRDLIDKMDENGDLMVNETAADAFSIEGEGYFAQQAILELVNGKTVKMWGEIPMTFNALTGTFNAEVLLDTPNQLKWSFQNHYWPELQVLFGLIYSTYVAVTMPLTVEYPFGVSGTLKVKTF